MARSIAAALPAAALLGVSVLTGCRGVVVTVATPSAPAAGQSSAPAASQPVAGSSPGTGRQRLARIADEGHVTYTITLTRCQTRDGRQLPDPQCTPGSIDPAVTQANIGSTICRSGYTARVRPPESQTERAKFDIAYPAYRIPHSDRSELDHLVSLELGGSNDITNLWPEVGPLPNPKDKVENALRRAVCDGQVSLGAAQRAIASNWMTAEAKLGLR